MRRCLIYIALAAAVALPGSVFADSINLTIEPLTQSLSAGNQVTFRGTLSALGAGPESIFIDTADLTSGIFALWLPDPDNPERLIFDDADFWMNAPLAMNPLPALYDATAVSSASFDLFTITAPLSALTGTYFGTFHVGGADSLGQRVETFVNFSLNVGSSPAIPVPTPGTLVLLVTGFAGVLLWRRS